MLPDSRCTPVPTLLLVRLLPPPTTCARLQAQPPWVLGLSPERKKELAQPHALKGSPSSSLPSSLRVHGELRASERWKGPGPLKSQVV